MNWLTQGLASFGFGWFTASMASLGAALDSWHLFICLWVGGFAFQAAWWALGKVESYDGTGNL